MSVPAFHFVAFKWKEGAPVDLIEKVFDEQKEKICDEISGIQSFVWGENSSPYNKGYTHGLIVQADNQDAIDRYRASKLRELTVPLFGEWVEDATSVDLSNPK
ncbi:MAG: Dabb family protein [Aestuariivita sp.]|nr:Dabb family protein [Aestuariivita sp.]MCY4203431.1 Dabb family protein [Aestuariivita sp.]MCY4287258.1 Dabb family protein [Aestuariivita sp.]MCY4348174.1 Dabb family protein [Aestuariivita sp.]